MTAAVFEDQMSVFADPSWREDLASLAATARATARAFAMDALTLHELAGRVPVPDGTRIGCVPWQSFVREVAVARGVQEQAAQRDIDVAVLLVESLPHTLQLLRAGQVTVGRAVTLAEELRGAEPEIAGHVDRELRRLLPVLAPDRVRKEVRRIVDLLDADAAAVRSATATAGRGVRLRAERDGQAGAWVSGPAVPMLRWSTALTQHARALQAAGDPRGLEALRFDLVIGGFALGAPESPTTSPQTGAPVGSAPGSVPGRVPEGERLPTVPTAGSTSRQQPVVEQLALQDGPCDTSAPDFDLDRDLDRDELFVPDVGPVAAAPPCDPDDRQPAAVVAAGQEAARLLWQARGQAERVLEAAHRAEAEALHRLTQVRAEHDRLEALVIRERLAVSRTAPADRRSTRPVQVLVHVPVTTALGLSQEPGWLEGYGWISAPQCRQLLPIAELRQVCVSDSGQVVDLAPRAVRPDPTPTGARRALLAMATRPSSLSDAAWQQLDQHDPSAPMADLVRVRDRFCDGPLGTQIPADRADLDHGTAHPAGPTAAWNLTARGRRTHVLKHAGWAPLRLAGETEWTSPAGQIATAPHHQHPVAPPPPDAQLPDPDAISRLEAEQLDPDW